MIQNLKRNVLLLTAVSIAMASASFFAASAYADKPESEKPKPNIVIILADDLGWQDVKCYDVDEPSPSETPNIDAFAKRGVMFWQAYSPAPTCAPSRCAIMSGNHPARAQKTHVVGGSPPAARSSRSRMMDPWYSGRIPEDEMTLAKAMHQNGYVTGHVGKWHMAIDHHAFPQPKDVGFDFTRSSRGAHSRMKDRLAGFATDAADDPFRLNADGYPKHQNNEDALTFLSENKDKPFFLYYATWLVHGPIMTRSKPLLDKYVAKLGVDPRKVNTTAIPGQMNPFYFAMVEMLDHYVGEVFDFLDNTDDPRWPGHKLSENTYIVFTSDNGGMEGGSERYTDNNPLDRGKISAKEGGTRVPLIVVGPGIAKGVQTDVLANGLDFYPTVLSLTGSPTPAGKHFDGCDLKPLLLGDPTDPTLVKDANGDVRDTMVWHFPHGSALESTIRIGDFKLIRNYDHVLNDGTPELELFRLYETNDKQQQRVDIEEANNLALSMPERTASMNRELTQQLTEMKASYPSYNPDCAAALPGKENVCTVLDHQIDAGKVKFTYRENGAKVVRADLLYTLNGGERYEEWFRKPAKLQAGQKVVAELPEGTTHYLINLIDENNFLRSYPVVKKNGRASSNALSTDPDAPVAAPEPAKSQKKKTRKTSAMEKDTNKDGKVSKKEYIEHFMSGFDRKDRNKDGVLSPSEHAHSSFAGADADKNKQLTRDEFKSIFEGQFRGLDKDNSGFFSAEEAK